MILIKRVLAILLVCLCSLSLKAHQPDLSSTVLVEKENNEWIIQIRAALTAFEYEIKTNYGASAYSSPEEFQELVLDHLKNNMAIMFDNNEVALHNGMVMLGHETSAVFQVDEIPDIFHSISVMNSSFSDISRNKGALIILKEGYSKDQFVLNNDNDHTIELQLSDSKFIQVSTNHSGIRNQFLIVTGVLLLSVVFFVLKKKAP